MELSSGKYEVCPLLCDGTDNLTCDFELITDEMASRTGLLRANIKDEKLRQELLWICEIIYHLSATLRTELSISEEEYNKLADITSKLQTEISKNCKSLVLPQGGVCASLSHILRVQARTALRIVYKHIEQGNGVEPLVLDILNLLSEYFFVLALKLNKLENIDEIPITSRNY